MDLYRLRVEIEHPRHEWRTHQWATEESRLGFGNFVLEQQREESRAARVLRKERNAARMANARTLYAGDATFARVYDATADIFADALRDDQIRVEAGKHTSVGYLPNGHRRHVAPMTDRLGSLMASSSGSTQRSSTS